MTMSVLVPFPLPAPLFLIVPARAAEMTTEEAIALAVRLGLIFLGSALMLRIAGALVGRMQQAIHDRAVGDEATRDKRAKTIGGIVRGVARVIIFIVGSLMAVRELGLDITPALAAAGGFGVAAGLGAQSIVKDWISGFFIINDDQYSVGDVVRVVGVAGTIEQLTLRHTELRDGDGSLHFIPNGEVKIVTNLTKSWAAPLVRVPVSVEEDPERALRVLDEMAREFKTNPATAPLLVDGPNVLGIDDVSGGVFTVLVQARTRPENRHPVTRALRLAAMRRLGAAGISLVPSAADGARAAGTTAGMGASPTPTGGASQ